MPGESVTFDSGASTGDPTGFQWDFDGDAHRRLDGSEPNLDVPDRRGRSP